MIEEIKEISIEDKAALEQGVKLPIMEEFYSIQGEGFNSGKAAYFIRVGGCDVGCHWCDVKESWNPNLHPLTGIQKVVDNVNNHPAKAIVVTGGEPTIYNLKELTKELLKSGVELFLETSGAYPITGKWHWICLSPKKTMLPLQENYQLAHELKVIIYNKHDLKWAEEQAQKVSKRCKLYLQPEWSKAGEALPIIIDYVMNNPQWEISLQTHKYMQIP